jgi:glycosyltransferase involved in cell wall biosynthesis
MIGERTGVGVLTAGLVQGLAAGSTCTLKPYAVARHGAALLASQLPAGVHLPWLPMASRPLFSTWERLDVPVIEWWTGPVDVVHGTNFVVPPAARAAEVVSIHDVSFVRFPQLCDPATLRYPLAIRRAVRRGAWIHALTEAMADEIAETFGAARERIRVVAPGIARARPSNGSARPSDPPQSTRGGRPYVLSLGRTEPRKDVPLLVRAFDQIAGLHPDLELLIAGPAGSDEEAVRADMATAHHGNRIRRLGWVSDDQKGDLLAGATVFAYPSVYEGFGMPPLEAMAAGVPVVATASPAVKEVVGSAAVLVPIGDWDALAAGLARVVDDAGRRAELVAAGLAKAEHFSWRRCTDGMTALYQEAASSRPRPRRGRRAR